MFDMKKIACGAVLAAAVSTGAAAQDFTNYGSVEGWNVFVDHKKESCVIEKSDEDMIVQMGLTKKKDMVYLGVFTKNQPGVEAGDMGDFIFDFDGDLFHGDVTAIDDKITEGYSGAYLTTNNPALIDDMANKNTFKAINKDVVFELSLEGSMKAMEMGRECLAAQN